MPGTHPALDATYHHAAIFCIFTYALYHSANRSLSIRILFILLVLLLLAPPPGKGQQVTQTDVRFRLAQSYARSGDYDSAIKILQELLKAYPGNLTVAEELRRDYIEVKRYTDAINLLQQQIALRPRDVNSASQLAALYYLNSEEAKAYDTWEGIIKANPKDMISYHMVGATMTQSRLFDRAIQVYLRGRTACANPTLFINEVAYLYTITSRYAEATREYLLLLKSSPSQLGYVQTSLSTYTNRPEGLTAAASVVEDASHAAPADLPLARLLAWVYMEGKQYDKAYDVYKTIDRDAKANGLELQSFAERALREKSYTVAARAFQEIINHYPKSEHTAEVKFGYAQALEASEEEADTLHLFGLERPFTGGTDPSSPFAGAIQAYTQVLTEFPGTQLAARALLNVGIIQQEKAGDLRAARASLEQLLSRYATFAPVAIEGTLHLGDVYLALDMLDKAREKYLAISGRGIRATAPQEEAAYRLAELYYFQARFDSALVILRDLTADVDSDVANDAIALQVLIQQHLQSEKPSLEAYAKANLLRRQRKWTDAISILESFPAKFPSSDLLDESLLAVGDIYTLTGRYTEALAAYDTLMARYPQSIAVDQTMMKVGEVYQNGLRDRQKAITTFEKLLEQYPSSIYVAEARKRVRFLRGDAL